MVVEAIKSIAEMDNIRKFVLGFDPDANFSNINFGVVCPTLLGGAITSLLRRPQLIEFTLHNLTFYPKGMLCLSKSIPHLAVLHSMLELDYYGGYVVPLPVLRNS